MADVADHAEEERALHLRVALSRTQPTLPRTGHCYNCDEPVAGVFCDADCGHDYERRQQNRRV
jgi:hypothetical protein